MIYGLQQERNFLCCTPNLRGYGERSHWPYKYHGPSTESGWIFILFKKKCQWGLIYDMQSTPSPTTPLFFGLISEPVKWKKRAHISIHWFKKKIAWNHQQVTELEFGYWRPEATDYLHFIDKEQRGASEKQRRCSQVMGSMPYFRVVTFSLPPWLLCDTIPSDRQRWQLHVPMYQNPSFSLSVNSQTSFYCDVLTRILC